MKKIVIVTHTPSQNTLSLGKSLLLGAKTQQQHLNILTSSPFDIRSDQLIEADGVIFFTTENFGYMSGALKDLFDRCYYDLLDIKRGTPYALVIRAGKDGTGAKRSCESILQGLGWHKVQEALILKGDFEEAFHTQVCELGEAFAIGIADGIF